MGEWKPTEEQLIGARRRLHHRLLAALMTAMADGDTSVETVAARLGKDPAVVYEWLQCFAKAHGATLDMVSDIASIGGGAEIIFSVRPLRAPPEKETDR